MAKRRRQLVLMCGGGEGPNAGALKPLGTISGVMKTLGNFNTGTDGNPDKGTGTRMLHGPGFTVEIATSLDPVSQAIVTLNDDDIALPVLFRLCKELMWKMVDMETGRTFG